MKPLRLFLSLLILAIPFAKLTRATARPEDAQVRAEAVRLLKHANLFMPQPKSDGAGAISYVPLRGVIGTNGGVKVASAKVLIAASLAPKPSAPFNNGNSRPPFATATVSRSTPVLCCIFREGEL